MIQKSYTNDPALYLVPTPIGDLEDITIRSINILKKVEFIFCEDTRKTKKLLNHYNINKKLISCHKYNEEKVKERVIIYLQKNKSIALVTDSGTPLISDPGYTIVYYIIKKGFNVIGLPGATAFIPALITSGLKPHPFLFFGFLSKKRNKKTEELQELKKTNYTIIFYESPYRVLETLKIIHEVMGNRRISIIREISKIFEEIYRDNIKDIIEQISNPKGEYVIVLEGSKNKFDLKNLSIGQHINLYLKEGYNEKEALKKVAKERKIKKSDLYKIFHTKGM